MNLTELNKVAEAMVAPGRGILAADESTGTIKKRFDVIGVQSTADARRDYREMLFRSADAMTKYISGVILYDETIRQNGKDGTPLVKLIAQAGALPGIKVDKGTKPLPFCAGEVVTEGLDGLRDRLVEYRDLGAKFAKWRAVIDIASERGMPSYTCVNANAHALARYAALCQDEDIVPIVEPEVLMDGDHDIDRCVEVTTWMLKETFQELFYNRVALEGMVLKPNMVVPGKKSPKRASVEEVADKTVRDAQGVRAGSGARHRVPLRRPIRRGRDGASRRHQQIRPAALARDLLLRPRVAGRTAEGMVGQGGKRGGSAARLQPPRDDERPRHTRPMEGRSRAEGRVTSSPSPLSTAKRGQKNDPRLYLVTPTPRGYRGAGAGDRRRHRGRRCRCRPCPPRTERRAHADQPYQGDRRRGSASRCRAPPRRPSRDRGARRSRRRPSYRRAGAERRARMHSSLIASPAPAGCAAVMMPCSRAKLAPTTSCSASPIAWVAGLPWTR